MAPSIAAGVGVYVDGWWRFSDCVIAPALPGSGAISTSAGVYTATLQLPRPMLSFPRPKYWMPTPRPVASGELRKPTSAVFMASQRVLPRGFGMAQLIDCDWSFMM